MRSPLLAASLASLASALLGCPTEPVAEPPTPADDLPTPTSLRDEVDVFVGTGFAGIGIGSTFPGPSLPFGLARPGPDSHGESATPAPMHCSGYSHGDPFITGFSHLHFNGMGVPDYGMIALMPAVGWDDSKRTEEGMRLRKDPATEAGAVGWYGVELATDAGPVRVELTTGERAALHRVTFPSTDDAWLILDLSHTIPEVDFLGGELAPVDDSGQEWAGRGHLAGAYSRRHGGEEVYVRLRVDRVPTEFASWSVEDTGGLDDPGVALGARLRFDATSDPVVHAAVGISLVDADGALANLEADLPGFDFEATRAAAEAAWDTVFDTVEVGGGGAEERAILASSLYHAFLMPSTLTDADGRYPSFSGEVRNADGWRFMSDMSLWDTYRTVHPLYDLLAPAAEEDMLRSLMDMYGDVGKVPRWPLGTGTTGGMIGDSAANVFAGAMTRGIGLDSIGAQAALDALEDTASQRDGQGTYFDLGYVAADMSGGSVSRTLEYAWNDAALADLADLAGDPRADAIRARSLHWRNHWDADTAHLRARDSAGDFVEPWWPDVQLGDYVEGTAWQYLWMAPHDPDGYAELFGDHEAAVAKLTTFFRAGRAEIEESGQPSFPTAYYWHGNEPDIHASYMFSLLGRHDLTVQWSRWVEDALYGLGPTGLVGNDDGGTLGAFYVWSALGLYPVAGTDTYLLGAPRFEHATMWVQDHDLAIVAPGLEAAVAAADEGVVTVLRVELDGAAVGPVISWDQLRDASELRFVVE